MTAEVTCTRCGADDLGCTACGAHGTLVAQPDAVRSVEGGGVTVTEWQMLRPDGRVYMNYRGGRWSTLRSMTRSRDFIGGTIEMRQRTTFPDVVTEWAEVSGDTEAVPVQHNVATFTHRLTEYGTTTCPVEGVRAHVDAGACSACGMAVPGDTEAGGHSVLICETPNGCTCGAPATTPRGMHHGYCTVRKPAPGNTEAGGDR